METNAVNYTLPSNRQILRDRLLRVVKESGLGLTEATQRIGISRVTLGSFMLNGKRPTWKTCVLLEKFCIRTELEIIDKLKAEQEKQLLKKEKKAVLTDPAPRLLR